MKSYEKIKQDELNRFENLIFQELKAHPDFKKDPAHDLNHFKRVVATSKKLCLEENAKMEVVMPAAWLHDLVNVSKSDPRRSIASQLSADAASNFLKKIQYPDCFLEEIKHAIHAHSYSANIQTKSIEASIVQDADRLDGLGAIGIARVFSVGGLLERKIYSEEDAFGEAGRTLNDLEFTVDHFFVKLFKTIDTLKTEAGKREGHRRGKVMRDYLENLRLEIS